jgi:serine/threonine protein kinase
LENLKIWKSHLKKCLNQQGFHKKYRSIKKIGKGSFATVYMVKRIYDDKIFAAKAFLKE